MNDWLIEYNPTNGELVPIYVSIETTNAQESKKNYDIINDSIISPWNNAPSWNQFLSKTPLKFHLIYHSKQDYSSIHKGSEKYDYSQHFLKHPTEPVPIIHFTKKNIFDGNAAHRWKKIIDSSIWNQYVYENDNLLADIRASVKKIGTYYDEKRYSLGLAHEYCDLHARLVEQSHLIEGGAHSSISPFLFHSEKEMEEKIGEYKDVKKHKNDHLKIIQDYKWRFLLLDDKSVKQMNTPSKTPIDINKLQIIAWNLQHILGFGEDNIWFRAGLKNDNSFNQYGKVKDGQWQQQQFTIASAYPQNPEEIQIVIDCVETIDEAKRCLQKYRYEVLLLDYLLDNADREYGYGLLDELQKWHKKRKECGANNKQCSTSDFPYKAGPNKRYFIMFISAFTTAVHERMLEKGYGKTERGLWHLGDGACPTNTPYLFSYQLLLLMRHRITDLRKENEGGFLTLIELLNEIFVKKDKAGLVDIRQNANNHFNHVLFMRNKYLQLEEDLTEKEECRNNTGKDAMNMESSLLIQSAFKYINLFSGSFFEHLQHLVYLVAFGTIRQWTELWEEYVFIHKTLTKYDELTHEDIGTKINEAIRNYIINLKENSN